MKLSRNKKRLKRKVRIRKKISGTAQCPRLCVFRSNTHVYAQLIDDDNGNTIVSASTLALTKGGQSAGANCTGAALVGREIARLAKEKEVESVVFDRNGYLYHGRVKALADGAREGGLKF